MTAMTFKLRSEPGDRLDLSVLTPHRLAGLDESAIAALPLNVGKAAVTVGDIFSITPGDVQDVRILGGSERFDAIGAKLSAGRITVEGDGGAYAGRGMSGGELHIEGGAGPFAGCGMSGGLLCIRGDAGDNLAAPRLGESIGLRGGMIAVSGHAGRHAGDRMRRGLIVIAGGAGDFPGSRMIAGTLAILGDCGQMPGYLMRRGTLLLQGGAASWTTTFGDSGTGEFVALRLLTRQMKHLLPSVSFAAFDGAVRRYAGDMAALGKGELIRPVG